MDFPSFQPNPSLLHLGTQINTSQLSLDPNLHSLDTFQDQQQQQQHSRSIEEYTLADLLRNQHVHTLYQSMLQATSSQMELHREMKELRYKFDALQAENAGLRAQQQRAHIRSASCSTSLAPSDSISQVSRGSQSPDAMGPPPDRTVAARGLQPYPNPTSICPDIYNPQEICWTKSDYQQNPANKRTAKNKSRPKMVDAIRHPSTKEGISQVQWDAIRSVCASIARPLMALPDPPKAVPTRGKGRTVEWFEKNYSKKWDKSIEELERREPILTYCASSWKARAVFRVVLRGLNNGKHGGTGTESDTETEAQPPLPATSPQSAKKRRRQSVSSSRKKKKGDEKVDERGAESSAPAVDNGASSAISTSLHTQIGGPLGGPSQLAAGSKPASTNDVVVDISFIQINHAMTTLKEEFASLPTEVAHSQNLLAALESVVPETEAGEPSSSAVALLEALEDADPNTCGFEADDDDNNNAGWGHYQYAGGGRTIRGNITSWEDVGSGSFVQKLLAAGLRTCKVARYVCEQRKRIPSGGYTSDAYLSLLVDHLWTILPVSLKPRERRPDEEGEINGEPARREDLLKLHLAELRDWITKKGIVCDGKPRRSKDDCASVILTCSTPSQKPSLSDIDSILKSRTAPGTSKSKKSAP